MANFYSIIYCLNPFRKFEETFCFNSGQETFFEWDTQDTVLMELLRKENKDNRPRKNLYKGRFVGKNKEIVELEKYKGHLLPYRFFAPKDRFGCRIF